MIRVLIVADVRLYREGLAQVLGRTGDLEIVGAIGVGGDLLTNVTRSAPDIVLMDLAIADCASIIAAMRDGSSQVRVVAFAVSEVESDVLACAEAGVAGYVPRDASVEDLVAVLQSVARGEALCSPRITGMLFRRVAALSAGLGSPPPLVTLTGREREIIRMVDRGLSNKEIARELGIELATVKNHVHNILEKLKVHRRGEAVARLRGPPHNQLRQQAL